MPMRMDDCWAFLDSIRPWETRREFRRPEVCDFRRRDAGVGWSTTSTRRASELIVGKKLGTGATGDHPHVDTGYLMSWDRIIIGETPRISNQATPSATKSKTRR